ncbi:MAG: alpha-hydroxy-acid oxidizing protein [Rhizobiaceae bacterium]|nr:alpha-hydroxy-acid oxidizing protein [Rhizobiaceae bacterium]
MTSAVQTNAVLSTSHRLRKVLALDDFELLARQHLPRPVFGYIANGSETNGSRDDNRAAFAEYQLLPKVLVDVASRSQSTSLFGVEHAAPFGIAPVGLSALAAYRGDLVLAQTARRVGIPMIMSGASLIRMEDVARAAPDSWFQAYFPGDVGRIDPFVDRIAAAGFKTLVATVDVPVISNRENAARAGFTAPLRPGPRLALDGILHPRWTVGTFLRTLLQHGLPHFENGSPQRGLPILARNVAYQHDGRDSLDWRCMAHLRKRWGGRLVVKGILRAEDARRAVGEGLDGIMVSNHGGRQLDGTPSPLRVLPGIVDAVGGAVPVMLDSGVRRGSDVIKALALGASFVFLGRPFIFAASVGGQAGVLHLVRLLADEIDRNMAMLGINRLAELDRSFCRERATSL